MNSRPSEHICHTYVQNGEIIFSIVIFDRFYTSSWSHVILLELLWSKTMSAPFFATVCPNNDCFFSKAHCSYKKYPILKISSLLGQQWIDFYVGIIYNNISSFWEQIMLSKVMGFIFSWHKPWFSSKSSCWLNFSALSFFVIKMIFKIDS